MDVKFRNIQNAICKAGSVLNAVNDEEPIEFGSRLLDKGMEALGFWGHANVSLNF